MSASRTTFATTTGAAGSLPEDLRGTLDEMARDAVVDNDGDPTAIVRGWLDDPELADEKDLGSDSLTQRGD